MIDVNELRKGVTFELDGQLFKVLDYSHNKPGRGSATIRIKARNLLTGANIEKTFNSGNSVQDVRLEYHNVQYLYSDGEYYHFMDNETYEQIEFPEEFVGERTAFLQDGMTVTVESYEEKPLGISLPDYVTLEITEADAVVKGQTASSSYKPAVLENGLKVMVPPFIATGEKIIVDTNEVTYVRRASES